MPEPLDYESRVAADPREPSSQTSQSTDRGADWPPPSMQTAVPADFDAILTQSNDHAAVAAVEAALRREAIDCFRVDDARERVGRQVRLLVRSADRDRASLVASEVFARRKRVRSFPHTKPVDTTRGVDVGRSGPLDLLP